MISENRNGIGVHRFGLLQGVPELLHGVSDRAGGVSEGVYHSLNVGLHVGDVPPLVVENRRRFCMAAGIDPARLVVGEQVHGGKVVTVTGADAGRGAAGHSDALAGADALVCAEPDVPLLALCADCPLVVIFDAEACVLGVVHASWRSLAAGIVAGAVGAMACLGAAPPRMLAGIGPCVGKCCYPVGADFADNIVHSSLPAAERYIEENEGRLFFDLPAAVSGALCFAGVPVRQIEAAGLCTSCNVGRFFSFRASAGKTGRFALVAQIARRGSAR